MNSNRHTIYIVFATALFLILYARSVLAAPVRLDYLYNLSDFSGVIPYNWVNITCDPSADEVYVVNTSDGTVRIFNNNGMEIFTFGDDQELGNVYGMALTEDGNILLLSYTSDKYSVLKANFRGEPAGKLELKDLPEGFSPKDFHPNAIIVKNGLIYLIEKGALRVLVTGMDGTFAKSYDIGKAMGMDDSKRADNNIMGFSVDHDGNLLYTIPTLFKAFVMSPDGKLRSFGTRGSAPGRFNIVAGIAADDKGNYYVADTLRAVVMVFDKDFKFQGEYGQWGFAPGNLVAPMDLAVANGKVFVSQSRARGVSVYRVLSPTEKIN